LIAERACTRLIGLAARPLLVAFFFALVAMPGRELKMSDKLLWLRMYTEVLSDPKVQTLPDSLFKAWINLLIIAKLNNQKGKLPESIHSMAFSLHLTDEKLTKYLKILTDTGLIDNGVMHGWEKRQYESDNDPTNNARQKRYREQHSNALHNASITPPRVQSTDTPKAPIDRSPIEVWTERLCERHPAPSDPRYPATFCADNWHRLGENEVAYAEWMQAVYRGLEAWCEHWAIDGNRFAQSLDKWLSGGGWKKAPPKVAESSNGKRGQQQSSLPDFDDLINDPYHGGPGR